MQPIYLNNDYPDNKQWRKVTRILEKNDKPLPRCDLLLKVICLRLSDNECVGTAMAVWRKDCQGKEAHRTVVL